MTAPARAASSWLALREDADGRSRATDLVVRLREMLPPGDPLLVHDLGCGTGSLARWLAPRLARPQHWVLHDRDADLLAEAATRPVKEPGGIPVSVRTRRDDVTRLTPAELSGGALITASALLDMLTAGELDRLADGCIAAGCPALITLSVVGRVELDPADPLDAAIQDAFNAHQRRDAGHGPLLGPDAVGAAGQAFRRRGAKVIVAPSPWRLGAADTALIVAWLDGWIGAAREQDPGLAGAAEPYLARRTAAALAGELRVTVHHQDMLVMPQ